MAFTCQQADDAVNFRTSTANVECGTAAVRRDVELTLMKGAATRDLERDPNTLKRPMFYTKGATMITITLRFLGTVWVPRSGYGYVLVVPYF